MTEPFERVVTWLVRIFWMGIVAAFLVGGFFTSTTISIRTLTGEVREIRTVILSTFDARLRKVEEEVYRGHHHE